MRFTRWDEIWSTSETDQVLLHLSEGILAGITGQQAYEVLALVKRRDLRSLCLFEVNYETATFDEVRAVRQVLGFFQKRADIDIGTDRRAAAEQSFERAEALCRESNEIFRCVASGGFFFPFDVESVLFRAQRTIARILGDVPDLSDLKLRFGPGATTTVKKKDASARRKLSQRYACSEDAIRAVGDVLLEMPLWAGHESGSDVEVLTHAVDIHHGRVDFVRKTAKTDRTIAVEPMLNSMVQLGIGDYMAKRLRREGVDLSNQSLNGELARKGSLTGALATLDLSSASDTVSSGLVASLLPFDWWDFLRTFRTGTVLYKTGIIRLEKFSSMGNGFTFPLESLIFYALAKASAEGFEGPVSVYGDDIIVPTGCVDLLTRVLTSCGFVLNKSKSYSSGPFRESCGKDYFSGIDIRPFYVKDALSGHTCFSMHNFFVRKEQPELARQVLELISEPLRLFGPDGFGDGHLLGDYDPAPHKRDHEWGGFTFETYSFKPRRVFYKLGADYVYPSYSIYLKGDSSPLGWLSSEWSGKGKAHGVFRPERSDSVYSVQNGQRLLTDTLPGIGGYKRIKIYVHTL